MTLNMLQECGFNPELSAYEALEGSFNFITTPLAPIGCKIIAHETPEKHKTWSPHGVDGFYLGPIMEHYRCHWIYGPKTCSERIIGAVEFQPQICETPVMSNTENAIIAANNSAKALALAKTDKSIDLKTMKAIQKIADIFQHDIVKTNEVLQYEKLFVERTKREKSTIFIFV